MNIACHYHPKNRRSTAVAHAMYDGARKLGIEAKTVIGFETPAADVGIAYGWGYPQLFEKYRQAGGHFIYVDLGWWNRKPLQDVLGGFHKVVVDAREPAAYFRRNFPGDRFARTGLAVAPWRQTGGHVLVAGMSEKLAGTRGFKPQEWENRAVALIRRICPGRPIWYRPKPSWAGAWPIAGTIYSPPSQPLERALADCWAVVSLPLQRRGGRPGRRRSHSRRGRRGGGVLNADGGALSSSHQDRPRAASGGYCLLPMVG